MDPTNAENTAEAGAADEEVTEAVEETAPADGAEETQAEGEAPAEGSAEEKTEGEEAEKPTEITEEALRAAAEKFAAEQLKAANKTMAAARRAQAQVELVQQENAQLKQRVTTLDNVVAQAAKDPRVIYQAFGYQTLRAYLEAIEGTGSQEAKSPTADDRVSALEKQLNDERREAARSRIFSAVEGQGDKYDLVATDIGKRYLQSAIDEYDRMHGLNGRIPESAGLALADEVQKGLEAELSKTKRFSVQRQDATKPGATTPATGKPAAVARNAGKTITNSRMSGATTGQRTYSDDWNESRKQVLEEMRLAGELA